MSIMRDNAVLALIAAAKREDLGAGDITTSLMDAPDEPASFQLLAKQAGVFAGRELAAGVLREYDPAITIEFAPAGRDGAIIDVPPQVLATLLGPLGAVLSAERVLLNFLQRLSGIATLTRRYVAAVAGTDAAIYDTRKTTPGWRALEKYAVRCGGGFNHRQGLYDAVLIKDNHLAGVTPARLPAMIFEMLNRLHASGRAVDFVEVEVDTLEQMEPLLGVTGIDVLLLDNFASDDLRRAVALRDDYGLRGKVALEASGGITLDTVRSVAETGVERVSVGAITHSAVSIDLSLERV